MNHENNSTASKLKVFLNDLEEILDVYGVKTIYNKFNNLLTIILEDKENSNRLNIKVYFILNRVIIERYARHEHTAFNLSRGLQLLETYFLSYKDNEVINTQEVKNKILLALILDNDYSLSIKQSGNIRIKATNCDISELHETDVVAFQIQNIEELKNHYICFNDKTELSLNSLYEKNKHIENRPHYVVYNLRRELFLYSPEVFHREFYFE